MELDPASKDNHAKGNRNFFQFKSFPGRVKSSRGIGETPPRASNRSESYLDQQERESFLARLGTEDALLTRDESELTRNDSKVRDLVPIDTDDIGQVRYN